MVFLARLAGTLERSEIEASRDAGDRGRVPMEGVSEEDRLSEVSLGERSEDDGGINGVARGERGRE